MEPSAVYDMVRIRGTLSFESFGFFGFLRFQYYSCSTFWEHLGVHDSWLYMYIYHTVRKILFCVQYILNREDHLTLLTVTWLFCMMSHLKWLSLFYSRVEILKLKQSHSSHTDLAVAKITSIINLVPPIEIKIWSVFSFSLAYGQIIKSCNIKPYNGSPLLRPRLEIIFGMERQNRRLSILYVRSPSHVHFQIWAKRRKGSKKCQHKSFRDPMWTTL